MPLFQIETYCKLRDKISYNKIKMDKISPIKERILQFIENQKITKADFCAKTGISYANLKGRSLFSEIGGDKIAEILSIYPEISSDWLVLGRGKMLKTDTSPSEPKQMTSDNTVVLNLVDRIEKLSAENAVLKREIEELKEEIRNKSNPNTYASAVAEP